MDAELRVADAEVARLAEELAELRQVSVRDALAAVLMREVAEEREVARRQEEIEAVARKVRSLVIGPPPSSDHSWLYGNDGLPI